MMDDHILHSPFQPIFNSDIKSHNSFVELLLEKSKEHAENGKTRWMVRLVCIYF